MAPLNLSVAFYHIEPNDDTEDLLSIDLVLFLSVGFIPIEVFNDFKIPFFTEDESPTLEVRTSGTSR